MKPNRNRAGHQLNVKVIISGIIDRENDFRLLQHESGSVFETTISVYDRLPIIMFIRPAFKCRVHIHVQLPRIGCVFRMDEHTQGNGIEEG